MQICTINNDQFEGCGRDTDMRDRDLDVDVGQSLREVVPRDDGHGDRCCDLLFRDKLTLHDAT